MEMLQKGTALTVMLRGHQPAQCYVLMEKNYELSKVQCSKDFACEYTVQSPSYKTTTTKFGAWTLQQRDSGILYNQLKEQLRLKQKGMFLLLWLQEGDICIIFALVITHPES